MNVYHYLFYLIYKRQNTKFSKNESTFFASMVLSCLEYLNLFTILLFLVKTKELLEVRISDKLAIISGVALFIINLFFFFWNKKYLKIENHYDKIEVKYKKLGNVLIVLYLLISFIFFFLAISYKK